MHVYFCFFHFRSEFLRPKPQSFTNTRFWFHMQIIFYSSTNFSVLMPKLNCAILSNIQLAEVFYLTHQVGPLLTRAKQFRRVLC